MRMDSLLQLAIVYNCSCNTIEQLYYSTRVSMYVGTYKRAQRLYASLCTIEDALSSFIRYYNDTLTLYSRSTCLLGRRTARNAV